MARCTAPVRGHSSASAAANCPACRGRYSRYSSGGDYRSYSPSSYSSSLTSGGGRSSGGGSVRSSKPRWSGAGSSILYTLEEVRALTPVRNSVENLANQPDLRDVFLCHAWDDRKGAAVRIKNSHLAHVTFPPPPLHLTPPRLFLSFRPLQPKSRSNNSRKKKQGKNRIQEEKIGVKNAIKVERKAGGRTGKNWGSD